MNSTIAILEEHGLIDIDQSFPVLRKLTDKQLRKLLDKLDDSLTSELDTYEKPEGLTPFSFLASASLRGDSGCTAIGCRINKARIIARYSALFCDSVVF